VPEAERLEHDGGEGPSPSPEDSDEPIRVILVDGHRRSGGALASLLMSERDIQMVGVSRDISSAVTMVDGKQPEVAVMDYRPSDRAGIEAASLLKRLRPNVRIVLVVSTASESVVSRALRTCTGVVSKDATADKLIRAVRSAAHGERVVEGEFVPHVDLLMHGAASRRSQLTSREQEVLRAISHGQTTAVIAQTLGLSEHTVRNHVRNILSKLDAHTKLEAVVHAARAGVLSLDDE
jgi:DNA-binding NarL/FixJ family response regulator